MPRSCSVCLHPSRAGIETALVAGHPSRSIATDFGLDHRAIHRHARNHLPWAIQAQALAYVEALEADELSDRIEPTVIAAPTEPAGGVGDTPLYPGSQVSRPRRLLELDDYADDAGDVVQRVAPIDEPFLSPDPATPVGVLGLVHNLRDRALAILGEAERAGDPKTALAAIREARGLLEALARLEPPAIREDSSSLAESTDWHRTRAALLTALAPYPEARIAVAAALLSTGSLS